MTAQLTMVRSADMRGVRIPLGVLVDGTTVGSLGRGQTRVHELPDGEHTVQTVWKSGRRSPPRVPVTLQEGEAETLYLGFVSERAAYLRSPTRATDYLVLSTATTAVAPQSPRETQIRTGISVFALLALGLNLIAPAGSTFKLITYVVWIVSILVVGVLLFRHFGRLYRSPDRDWST